MISDEYFANLSQKLLDDTEGLNLSILQRIRNIALALVGGNVVNLNAEEQKLIAEWNDWNDKAKEWTDENLPKAYRQGLSEADKTFTTALTAGAFLPAPIFGGEAPPNIPPIVREQFDDLPNHMTMYSVFRNEALNDFQQSRIPVLRSSMDVIRDLVILSSDEAYINADSLTRRQLSEEIMRPFANRGVTGIRYSDGRVMRLESYAEMVARTQTGNAARQANFNRIQEYGGDLVLISQHYPTSDLCAPYQGRVFSISGTDGNYPSLQSAISGGLYHVNCKHSQSGYKRGQKIPEAREKVDSAENKRRYQASQTQRYNERQIRAYKRRQKIALTDSERQKATAKVREWQKRNRELLDENDFLRRRYDREQI